MEGLEVQVDTSLWSKILWIEEETNHCPSVSNVDMEKPFLIHYDASGQGLWCALMQDGNMVAYASHQLRNHEEYYLIHDVELATVVPALKI
jgi:hypothetical protein